MIRKLILPELVSGRWQSRQRLTEGAWETLPEDPSYGKLARMFKDPAPKSSPQGFRRARKLRKRMSLPEVLLWKNLRKRPQGLKFRRQHETGDYVLDFYCIDAKLAVEVDGIAHEDAQRAERDRCRDLWLGNYGIETLRVPARNVLADPDAAATAIVEYARARLPLHHPAAPDGPPPRDKLGEDRG